MRVLHLSPTYFSSDSIVGGGERYAYELAKAMAAKEEVCFMSFSKRALSTVEGNLRREYLHHLFSWKFLRWLHWAQVIHCYQVHQIHTDLAILLGKWLGKKVYVTDLGAGSRFALSYHFPILKFADALLLISEYSRQLWMQVPERRRPARLEVIWGGVDPDQFSPGTAPKSKRLLFVGRLLTHKGVDVLVDAVESTFPLDIVGKVYDQNYYRFLEAKAKDKAVTFCTDVDDAELVEKYRRALVTIQPSVYETCFGEKTLSPELLGLAVLESLACGTPAIVTNVASFPEVVRDGVDGFLVPPNDPKAIREKINYLGAHPEAAAQMGQKGREEVLKRFTWQLTVDRCLSCYHLNV